MHVVVGAVVVNGQAWKVVVRLRLKVVGAFLSITTFAQLDVEENELVILPSLNEDDVEYEESPKDEAPVESSVHGLRCAEE